MGCSKVKDIVVIPDTDKDGYVYFVEGYPQENPSIFRVVKRHIDYMTVCELVSHKIFSSYDEADEYRSGICKNNKSSS